VENLISLSSASFLVALALLLLVAAVSRLGRTQGLLAGLQALGLVTLKFAVLALGLGWMARQPWFRAPAAAFGIALPLIGLVLWKGRPAHPEKNDA
jgi:hypothetical protein